MAASPRPAAPTRLVLLGVLAIGFAALAGIAIGAVGWLALAAHAPSPPPGGSGGAYIWPAPPTPQGLGRDTAVRPASAAPAVRLTDQDGRPFDLTSLRGEPVLVFFGYTHCPDVCPTNLADVRDALKLVDQKVGVVFITIDPDRDDAAAMKQYVDYYQSGYIGLTGTDEEIRTVADAWGASYAKIDATSPSNYAMAHTADTFLVDAEGRLRHQIWFGAGPAVLADRINGLAGQALQAPGSPAPTITPQPTGAATPAFTAAPSIAPTAASTPRAATTIRVRLESSIVRAGRNRIVVTVSDQSNRELATPDTIARFSIRLVDDTTVAPINVTGLFIWVVRGGKAAYVIETDIPRAGPYKVTVTLDGPGGRIGSAEFAMKARAQGPTPQIGSLAPSARTPVASDVNGNLQLISTDVFPDERFYQHSVDELLAAGRPFVLTLYSPAFCPTTACGPLLKYMKEIANEFPTMTFVHAEPYAMRDVGGRIQPELDGPKFKYASWSVAYGIPFEPFVFVVGPDGRIVATFEVIVGSDEIRAAIRTATGE